MELKIQSIQFNVTEKLQAFIQKKFAKIAKFNENISAAEVILKVTKPETANNKSTVLNINVPGENFHVEKVCDTFEEGVDLCMESMLRQLSKYKEKQRGKKADPIRKMERGFEAE